MIDRKYISPYNADKCKIIVGLCKLHGVFEKYSANFL